MKPIFERLVNCPDEGFMLKEIHGEACNCSWHCHAEVELILVLRSQGYRIVGDSTHSLDRGDLVLLGPNLPHAYQHTDRFSASPQPAHCILVQFEEPVFAALFALPAMAPVRRMLARASNGLQFPKATRKQVAALLLEMLQCRGVKRIARFLGVLELLAQSRSAATIASSGFTARPTFHEQERVSRACQFIDENYHRPLRLAEVAKVAHMSEGAFGRFFRCHMGQRFPAFVNELRIGRACRLLAETDRPVTAIAQACGYSNLSNFNRQFLRLKGVSPVEFRRQLDRTS